MGDIGGTKDDLAAVEKTDTSFNIVFKREGRTSDQEDFSEVVNTFLTDLKREKDVEVDSACFAVAGPVENQSVEMPNANLTVDGKILEKETELEDVLIINDFDALGHAVNVIDEDDFKTLQEGNSNGKKPIAVVGAGTGLGKNLLIFEKHEGSYLPHSSEGGHADLPVKNRKELKLVKEIKERHGLESEVSYEHVLSGRGLENIYSFLQSEYPEEKQNLSDKEISETRDQNSCSKHTFEKFIEFYARCCRNYALETVSENGLYIVGGIAAGNPDAFGQNFVEEFQNVSPKFKDLISQIPIKLVTNYDISLIGAAHALRLEKEKIS